jgi:predicted membrane channel-forming protein YqfA (hemolysin III family)
MLDDSAASRGEASDESSPTLLPDKKSNYLLSFSPPDNPSPEEQMLAADVVILDHRANHQLKPPAREWQEVIYLLYNVVSFLHQRDPTEGRVILEEAERVYYHHNQTKNRIRYLLGVISGIAVAACVGATSRLLARSLDQYIPTQLLMLLFVFAGIGSVTSVLTRISSIDLKNETSNFSVFLSGFSRPLIAIFFALIVYLILDTKILDMKLGNPTDSRGGAIYLVTSFLCGFSERFAQDIISRVPFASKKPTEQEPE